MNRRSQGRCGPSNMSSASRLRTPVGFDFTSRMRNLCEDIVTRLPEMAHIQIDRVAISYSQARKRVSHGLYATLTPMRFEDGATTGRRNGRNYSVQRLHDEDGREMLYILSFYLPRFMDVPFKEKLVTIFHELWHISPDFNGDLRRHEGRCYVHTHSQKAYDAEMGRMVDRWLKLAPPRDLYDFLHHRFDELARQQGGIYGVKIPHPKLIPIE